MNYPPSLQPTLEALYRLGKRVCVEVEIFQPDPTIGLAHSGWMPVVVAQALRQRAAQLLPAHVRFLGSASAWRMASTPRVIGNFGFFAVWHAAAAARPVQPAFGGGIGRRV